MKIKDVDINDLGVNTFNVEKHKVVISKFSMDVMAINEKQATQKYIRGLLKLIRGSFEYSNFIAFMREDLDLNKCKLHPDLNIKETSVGLEFHHTPMTIHDITDTIVRYKLYQAKEEALSKGLDPKDATINSFDVRELVMYEHYQNAVGLMPLTPTMHEMVHNNSLIEPLDCVHGDYESFYIKYEKYMSDDVKARYHSTIKRCESDNAHAVNKEKLEKKLIHLDVTYDDESDGDDFFD